MFAFASFEEYAYNIAHIDFAVLYAILYNILYNIVQPAQGPLTQCLQIHGAKFAPGRASGSDSESSSALRQ